MRLNLSGDTAHLLRGQVSLFDGQISDVNNRGVTQAQRRGMTWNPPHHRTKDCNITKQKKYL